MPTGNSRVVLITAPPDRADVLARGLVAAKLAACVNIVPGVVSHYRWKGKISRDKEALLVCKTRASLLKKLGAYVSKRHPYEIPEVVGLPIVFGHRPYLDWLFDATR